MTSSYPLHPQAILDLAHGIATDLRTHTPKHAAAADTDTVDLTDIAQRAEQLSNVLAQFTQEHDHHIANTDTNGGKYEIITNARLVSPWITLNK